MPRTEELLSLTLEALVRRHDLLSLFIIDPLPGGSGVQSVLSAGQMIQGLIDGEKSFDVLSFDPRGVAFSTPSAHCFDDYLADEIWDFKMRVVGHLDTGPEAIKMQFANEKGRAALCAEAASYDGSDDNIRAYMTTAYVARDMLEIVTKNHVVEGGESSGRHGTAAAHTDQRQQPLQRNSKAQLQYIGVSYGTFLGNTFASMYPEHVGKMLLDGNVDADDWVRRWPKTFLPDFEEGWSTFFERCYAVGSTCALWRSSDKVAADIRTRVDSTLEQVKNSPIPILSHGSTELITYSDIKNAIFASNYDAAGSFPRLASFLNAIHTGNTTQSLPGWIGTLSPPISCPAPNTSAWPNEAAFFSRDASFATLCSDGPSLSSTPPSSFQSYLTLLSSQSPTAAPILASWILACMAWPSSSTPLKPKWRFTGPFGTTATSTNSTATPILFLNNRLDPVCPIRNARKMAERYEGSVVLEQDAVGHCALTASLGACVRGWVRRYFNEGVLPEVGTVCEGGCRAFDEGCAVGEEAIKLW